MINNSDLIIFRTNLLKETIVFSMFKRSNYHRKTIQHGVCERNRSIHGSFSRSHGV